MNDKAKMILDDLIEHADIIYCHDTDEQLQCDVVGGSYNFYSIGDEDKYEPLISFSEDEIISIEKDKMFNNTLVVNIKNEDEEESYSFIFYQQIEMRIDL